MKLFLLRVRTHKITHILFLKFVEIFSNLSPLGFIQQLTLKYMIILQRCSIRMKHATFFVYKFITTKNQQTLNYRGFLPSSTCFTVFQNIHKSIIIQMNDKSIVYKLRLSPVLFNYLSIHFKFTFSLVF